MTRHPHHLFLSDAHIGAFSPLENRAIEQSVLELIDHCELKGIRLHILGDLFDYWMEYPGRQPLYGKRLLERFAMYHERVGRTHYITGNHDNWTRGAFRDAGFRVVSESAYETFGVCRALLLHGDGLPGREWRLPRPVLNRLLRNPLFTKMYQLLLPERVGLALMKRFSALNRRFKKTSNPERLDKWAQRHLEKSETDLVLCGHDHLARVETFRFGTYINLGNFYREQTLAEYTNGVFRLVIWDMDGKQITPLKTYPTIYCGQ